MVWLDGLDVPIVNIFDTSFAERHPDETQPHTIPEGDSLARYGANLLPVDFAPSRPSSPIFNYPYSRSREALEQLHRDGPLHPCHGVKMRYVNPATGGYPMPTIGAFLQLLPRGFKGEAYRATDAAVFSVVEGKGRTLVGGQTFEWGPRDIFVAPSWCPSRSRPTRNRSSSASPTARRRRRSACGARKRRHAKMAPSATPRRT